MNKTPETHKDFVELVKKQMDNNINLYWNEAGQAMLKAALSKLPNTGPYDSWLDRFDHVRDMIDHLMYDILIEAYGVEEAEEMFKDIYIVSECAPSDEEKCICHCDNKHIQSVKE